MSYYAHSGRSTTYSLFHASYDECNWKKKNHIFLLNSLIFIDICRCSMKIMACLFYSVFWGARKQCYKWRGLEANNLQAFWAVYCARERGTIQWFRVSVTCTLEFNTERSRTLTYLLPYLSISVGWRFIQCLQTIAYLIYKHFSNIEDRTRLLTYDTFFSGPLSSSPRENYREEKEEEDSGLLLTSSEKTFASQLAMERND